MVKKSRFIATIIPVFTLEDIEKEMYKIKKEMKKASHSAYAYRILQSNGEINSNFHDDGEVPSTAGLPIFNALNQFEMINVLLVVTRFYGGINLGKGGLIRAYSGAARDLLQNIQLLEFNT